MVDCGASGGAISYDLYTASADAPGGTVVSPFQFGAPIAQLTTAARLTLRYDDNAAMASPTSVQNTSCSSGCTVTPTLPVGVNYIDWCWQTAADANLACSKVNTITVQ
jgi:hypothetical protein